MAASRDKLDVLDKADKDRVARETALNELQSFTFDLNDKLEQVRVIYICLASMISSRNRCVRYIYFRPS